MNLKIISIASMTALALAGAACSQTEPAGQAVDASVTPVSADADDGFNLRIPGEVPADTAPNDGFNLGVPDYNAAPASDGFNLPTDLPSSGGLDALPELDTSILDDAAPEPDVDEIIRLEP